MKCMSEETKLRLESRIKETGPLLLLMLDDWACTTDNPNHYVSLMNIEGVAHYHRHVSARCLCICGGLEALGIGGA